MFKGFFYGAYALLGVGGLVLFGIFDLTGAMLPQFGTTRAIETGSRRGEWYSRPIYVAPSSGRSPGGGGSYGGGGGWSGGK